MGKVAKPWSFCCAHVAVSMGEAAKPQSLLLLCRRRVYEGSCKTSVCACPLASPCLWGKLQNFVRFAALLRVYGENCKTSVSACCFIFSRMCSEGFPFIVWGSGGWLDPCSPRVARRVVVASLIPCLLGKLQNLSFLKVSTQVVMSFCVAGVALCDIPTCLITC